MPVYQPGVTFSDVPAGHWAETDLALVYEQGLAAGYPDGTFKPDNSQSRIETVVFMARVIRRLQAIEALVAALPTTSATIDAVKANLRQSLQVRHPADVTVPADASPVNTTVWNALHRVTIA